MKVLVFPYDKNPYQGLLYGAMKRKYGSKIKIRYAWFLPYVGALHFPLEIAIRRLLGYQIIHIHWIAFYLRVKIPKHELISYHLTRFNFWWMKKLGYKVIWTVHDITPHDRETIDDLGLSKLLSALATKIVHSSQTIKEMEALKLITSNTQVIPIGDYGSLYSDNISREDARHKLGIHANETVILFFGIIKAYKGVEDLVAALDDLHIPNTRLVIAGECSDASIVQNISKKREGIKTDFYNEFITNDDVAMYFKACDLVCLPFRSVTTSSSILLAMSFSKPAVAPRIGALTDIPSDAAIFYADPTMQKLKTALSKAIADKNTLQKVGLSGKTYSQTLGWDSIASKTYEVYSKLSQ